MIRYINNLTDNIEDAKYLIGLLKTSTIIGLDTETTGLDPFTSQVLLVQISVGGDDFVINRGGVGISFVTNLLNLINDNSILCIGHNIKFDMKMLRQDTGIWIKKVHDTMIIEAVLTSGLGGKFVSLLDLVAKYCEVYLEKETRLDFLEMNHESSFSERQITYSATDVHYLYPIYTEQMRLAKEANLEAIVDLECKVEPVVAKMEREGIILDIPYWSDLTGKAEIKLKELEIKLKELLLSSVDMSKYSNAFEFSQAVAIPVKTKKLTKELESILDPNLVMGWVVDNLNIHSHKQLLTLLNLIGIKTPDTNEKTLKKLPENKYVATILDFRDYEKRLSTYGYNVIEAVNPVTGRIHADFNQVGTASGRFSSSGGVNMQNIPTHDGYREGFVARPDYTLLAVDYSQQEYRLAGAITREPKIIEAYVNGFDMHTATAALRFNKELKDVTKDERNKGKAVNFTILYGGTEYALGKNLDIPKGEAEAILAQFLESYPVLAQFKEKAENRIAELGYSVTLMGRRRYWQALPIFATPKEIVNYENRMKREGFNHCIQGTGADVTKLAMHRLDTNNPFGDKFIPLLQVHDEVVAEVHDSIAKEAEEWMKFEMEEAFRPFLGIIPAKTDSKLSKRWTKS